MHAFRRPFAQVTALSDPVLGDILVNGRIIGKGVGHPVICISISDTVRADVHAPLTLDTVEFQGFFSRLTASDHRIE